jgi:hypothetical protein
VENTSIVIEASLEGISPEEKDVSSIEGHSSFAFWIASLFVRSNPLGNTGPRIGHYFVGTTLLKEARASEDVIIADCCSNALWLCRENKRAKVVMRN